MDLIWGQDQPGLVSHKRWSFIEVSCHKVACGLQPSSTTARAGQANTGGIRGKVRGLCGAKVGATDGNGGKYTKGGIDYDRRNLIRGGSVVGYWLLNQLKRKRKKVINW